MEYGSMIEKYWNVLQKSRTTETMRVRVWPDEVQQSISGGHHRAWSRVVMIFICAGPWVDDEHQNDSDDDSDEGRPQVVGDGQDSQATACLRVHGWEAGHKTGWKKQKWSLKRGFHWRDLTTFCHVSGAWLAPLWPTVPLLFLFFPIVHQTHSPQVFECVLCSFLPYILTWRSMQALLCFAYWPRLCHVPTACLLKSKFLQLPRLTEAF